MTGGVPYKRLKKKGGAKDWALKTGGTQLERGKGRHQAEEGARRWKAQIFWSRKGAGVGVINSRLFNRAQNTRHLDEGNKAFDNSNERYLAHQKMLGESTVPSIGKQHAGKLPHQGAKVLTIAFLGRKSALLGDDMKTKCLKRKGGIWHGRKTTGVG